MILTTATVLLAIATAAMTVDAKPGDTLLACAAQHYRAADALERTKHASSLTAAKGMGAIVPAHRHHAEAARRRAQGDDFREQAGSSLPRREIADRYAGATCPAG